MQHCARTIATAVVRDRHGHERRVPVIHSPSTRWGRAAVAFRAPSKRRCSMRDIYDAQDALERHPGFVRWAA